MNITGCYWTIRKIINVLPCIKSQVALTFDDGHKYAAQVVEKLNEYNVKATFFLCGSYIETDLDIYKNISKSGHEIGNHSYSHPNMLKISKNEILTELSKTQQLISQITNTDAQPLLFRFPYGSQNDELIQFVEKQGYVSVSWTIDTKDWTGISAEEIYYNISKSPKLKNGAIILMHTSGKHTLEALDLIIPALKNSGYKMVLISELFQSNAHYKKIANQCQLKDN